MSSSSTSRCSISKQRGAEISSRLIPPKGGRDSFDRADDLLGILGRQTDRKGVHLPELLEQHGLAFHYRHGRFRPDIAQPQHGRTIRHDRHGVTLDRQRKSLAMVGGNRITDTRHAGRVGHRKLIAGFEWNFALDGDLAAQVKQKGTVAES